MYFNQGLNLYYSYHLTESVASFKEAARFDSTSAMAYWGEALAMGPYYNNYYYKMPFTVLPVIRKMNRFADAASAKEKDLIETMNKRYSGDTLDSRRAALDRAYSAGLKGLISKYPADQDIKALYIDGVMLEHKWDFWTPDGKPKEWTPELVSYCGQILRVNPRHPAALHYQIHLVEASPHPEDALHSADVLQAIMPGVGHMVHMASHMYQRNGLYGKGEEVNERSNDAANLYDSLARNLNLGRNVLVHVYAVQTYCAMNGGMFEKSMHAASRCRSSILVNNRTILNRTNIQYSYMMPVFAWVRLGRWQEIIDAPVPEARLGFACLLNDFARGLAYIRKGKVEAAKKCLDSLRGKLTDSSLAVRNLPFNAPIQAAEIAGSILDGEILFAEKKYDESIAAFKKAMKVEDGMIYREPKEWPIPVRHFLGACLLKLGRAIEAEKIYHEDLVLNPGNGWSLLGLYQSLQWQKKKPEAAEYKTKYMRAFADAEVTPPASAY
jgi:tetratricopeptide (TPR) repeat protein